MGAEWAQVEGTMGWAKDCKQMAWTVAKGLWLAQRMRLEPCYNFPRMSPLFPNLFTTSPPVPTGEGWLQGPDVRGADPASGSPADRLWTHPGPVVPAKQLWHKLQALHETGYEGMETEELLREGKGLVGSLVLRIRKGKPLRLNELVYVEVPSRHNKKSL